MAKSTSRILAGLARRTASRPIVSFSSRRANKFCLHQNGSSLVIRNKVREILSPWVLKIERKRDTARTKSEFVGGRLVWRLARWIVTFYKKQTINDFTVDIRFLPGYIYDNSVFNLGFT
uniref:Uncharacterized protein n=1 Tax=Romanomermis culicivorax TaxID=13658 RepID=A0A915IHH6_ROMCU